MCRFLMARSLTPFHPAELLMAFAGMAEASRAPDGDRQKDGWGVGWLDPGGRWHVHKSDLPVWADSESFFSIPSSRTFLVHARSASFPGQNNNPAFNQPFVAGAYGFVFNGLLQGVSLPVSVPGEIGSQKIWSLLSMKLRTQTPVSSVEETARFLVRHSRRVQALNIGLCEQKSFTVFSQFDDLSDYYRLWSHDSQSLKLVCSEPLAEFNFVPVPAGRPLVL
jgi:predicted glutamine amidotransferase